MRKRFTWVLAVAALVSVGLTVACSSKYSASNNGLIVVSTQGNAVMDSFSLNLGNGHVTQIYNVNGPPTNGVPTAVVLDPAGANAYLLVTQSTFVNQSSTGVESFPVGSDGKLGSGTTTTLANATFTPSAGGAAESVPVMPVGMVIDSSGKLLFIADAETSDKSGTPVPGAVSVLSVNNGSLKEVAGSPLLLTGLPGSTTLNTTPSASALAVTPTVFPAAYASCSGNVAPTSEHLYVTDSNNYVVLNYSVTSSGALTLVSENATGKVPSGVTVDPCNRFVYVSNGQPDNTVSAFTICSVVNVPTCPAPDYSLVSVSGSPFLAGFGPGPLMMDAYANYLYVLDTQQGAVSPFRASTTTGALTPLATTLVSNNGFPMSIAIRSDDSYMFVTDFNSATLSEYSITPSSGLLTPLTPVQTDNQPWGVAVK